MTRTPSATLTAGALTLALATSLTACGDDNGEKAPSSPSPAASPSGTAPADPAAAEKQIRHNWNAFFNPSTSLANKTKYLEHGEKYQRLLQGFVRDPRVGQVKSTVKKVSFTSATSATVSYSLTLKGRTALPNASGTSVLQDKEWKVSHKSLCSLLSLNRSDSGSPAPAC